MTVTCTSCAKNLNFSLFDANELASCSNTQLNICLQAVSKVGIIQESVFANYILTKQSASSEIGQDSWFCIIKH